jgi:hypothetical protein
MMDQTIRNKKIKALELPALNYDPNSQDVRLTVQEEFVANQKIICLLSVSSFTILIG